MAVRLYHHVVLTILVILGGLGLSAHGAKAAGGQGEVTGQSGSAFWMHAGVEPWHGDITYRVGYPVTVAGGQRYYGHFPFSELEFPLDAFFGVVKAGAILGDRLVLNAQVKKDVSEPDDDLVGRSWVTSSLPWRLDVYSRYEVTDFNALVVDGDLSFKFLDWNFMWLAVGAGYMYQDFEYETALLHQWSPSGLTGYDSQGDGSTSIIYEVDCKIPYILLSGRFDIVPGWRINARVAAAPWVQVEDRDQHLQRNKVNVGDMDGSAVLLSIDTQYDITPQLFVTGGLSHTYIDVDGEMEASFNGVYDHTLAEELESRQTAVYVTIGFRFGTGG